MTDTIAHQAILLSISGRVQGVGYRDWMIRQAQGLGVQGWVRNRRDGTVEALIVGEPGILQDVCEICRRGPLAARVDAVTAITASDVALAALVDGKFVRLPTN